MAIIIKFLKCLDAEMPNMMRENSDGRPTKVLV